MDEAAFEQAYGAFQGFHAYFRLPLFGRRETRDHSRHYLQSLLVQSGERHNAENLSETVPASARVMQRFLAESPWDYGPAGLTVAGRLELRRFQPQFQHSRRALCPLLFVLLQHNMDAGRVSPAAPLERRTCGAFWVQPMTCHPPAGGGSKAGVRGAGPPHDGVTLPLRRD